MADATPSTPRRLPRRQRTTSDRLQIVLPVHYRSWLNGDIGEQLQRLVASSLAQLEDVDITRTERGFLISSPESPGPFFEAVHRAALDLERMVAARYPVFHHEIGPVWTGTLQAVFA